MTFRVHRCQWDKQAMINKLSVITMVTWRSERRMKSRNRPNKLWGRKWNSCWQKIEPNSKVKLETLKRAQLDLLQNLDHLKTASFPSQENFSKKKHWLINVSIWCSLILTGFNVHPHSITVRLLHDVCVGLNILGLSQENFAALQLLWVRDIFYVNPSKWGSKWILFSPQVRNQGSPYHCSLLVLRSCLLIFLTASDLSLLLICTWLLSNGKLKTCYFFTRQI